MKESKGSESTRIELKPQMPKYYEELDAIEVVHPENGGERFYGIVRTGPGDSHVLRTPIKTAEFYKMWLDDPNEEQAPVKATWHSKEGDKEVSVIGVADRSETYYEIAGEKTTVPHSEIEWGKDEPEQKVNDSGEIESLRLLVTQMSEQMQAMQSRLESLESLERDYQRLTEENKDLRQEIQRLTAQQPETQAERIAETEPAVEPLVEPQFTPGDIVQVVDPRDNTVDTGWRVESTTDDGLVTITKDGEEPQSYTQDVLQSFRQASPNTEPTPPVINVVPLPLETPTEPIIVTSDVSEPADSVVVERPGIFRRRNSTSIERNRTRSGAGIFIGGLILGGILVELWEHKLFGHSPSREIRQATQVQVVDPKVISNLTHLEECPSYCPNAPGTG